MAFFRSNSGMRNYALFHGAACTIYIEGKSKVQCVTLPDSSEKTFDEIFYSAILKKVIPEKKFIIKPVGSKNEVLAYAKKICSENIKNSFVIMDRDHEGILSSIIENVRVIRTHGYSWENDFWTKRLCLTTLNELILQDENYKKEIFFKKYTKIEYRISRISKIDILAKIHGLKYIPTTDRSVGLTLEKNTIYGVSAKKLKERNQIKKIEAEKISQCSVVKNIYSSILGEKSKNLIRGHLWEHACIHLISNIYKNNTGERSLPNAVVKRIGFRVFSHDPEFNFDPDTYLHYKKSLIAASVAAST